MLKEYSDIKQRTAVCYNLYKGDSMAKQVSMEIFAIGKWNGLKFTAESLKKIADNFKKLKNVHKVPLKFGHNQKQPLTDGQPAIGWLENVWFDDATGKLMALATDVPEIVFNAIKKKLYRKVSVELDRNVKYKDKQLGDVLSGVALLGADIPAVNTIADLTAYMSKPNADYVFGEHVAFTAIETEETIMPKELEDLLEQQKIMLSRLDKQQSDLEVLKDENIKLKAEKETFAAEKKAREEKEAEQKIVFARKQVTDILEAAVKAEAITPAEREHFTKLLNVDDDAAVQAIDIDVLKGMVDKDGKLNYSKEQAESGKEDITEADTIDTVVMSRAQNLVNDGKTNDFAVAMEMVFTADPKLAAAYRDQNDNI